MAAASSSVVHGSSNSGGMEEIHLASSPDGLGVGLDGIVVDGIFRWPADVAYEQDGPICI